MQNKKKERIDTRKNVIISRAQVGSIHLSTDCQLNFSSYTRMSASRKEKRFIGGPNLQSYNKRNGGKSANSNAGWYEEQTRCSSLRDCLRTRRSKAQLHQFRVHVQVQHAFWYISLPSLHDHDVKCFYVKCGGREFKLGRAVTYILWDQGRIQDFF